MNRLLFIIILLYNLCLCSCVDKKRNIEVCARFDCVKDDKPRADSLYEEWIKERNAYNPRYIELTYIIRNETSEKLYIPLKTWSDTITNSYINVLFINNGDTIYPNYSVKKVPYNSEYINRGDSMIVFVKIHSFEKWEKNEINVRASVESLISKLHIEYIKRKNDDILNIPNIKFDRYPRIYYEIYPSNTYND